MRTRYHLAKERSEARMALERDKDTIYYLEFIPKNGQPTGRSTLLDDPWCVRLCRNPNGDVKLIENAVSAFEERHKVASWREVAVSYRVNSFWYP